MSLIGTFSKISPRSEVLGGKLIIEIKEAREGDNTIILVLKGGTGLLYFGENLTSTTLERGSLVGSVSYTVGNGLNNKGGLIIDSTELDCLKRTSHHNLTQTFGLRQNTAEELWLKLLSEL